MRAFRVCGVSIAALSMQDAATRLVEAAIERRSYQVHLCNYTSLAACIQIPRIVTVIHDLQFLTFPQYFSRRKRLFQRLAVKTTCRRSSSVVAISKFTASEVLRFEPSVCSKLTAIPNPIDWSRFRDHARPATAGTSQSASSYFRQRSIRTRIFKRLWKRLSLSSLKMRMWALFLLVKLQ